jgi:hypothetical protein
MQRMHRKQCPPHWSQKVEKGDELRQALIAQALEEDGVADESVRGGLGTDGRGVWTAV